MFSKPAKGGEAAELSSSRKLSGASLVAEGVATGGEITPLGDMRLDGAVEGDLKAGRLTVGETGLVTGSIQADSVEIRGRVTGTIVARVVKLWATARVDGDISHTELAIDAGA